MNIGRSVWDSIERAIPFVLPALGGGLGVLWVNLNPMQFLNPMIWIPLGIFLGWATGRLLLRLIDKWRS